MKTLSNRGKLILEYLLDKNTIVSNELEKKLNVSKKTLLKEIDLVNAVLEDYNSKIYKKPRVGIWLQLDKNFINEIYSLIALTKVGGLFNSEQRKYYIIIRLLENNDYITMDNLAEEMFVSKGTLVADFKKVEEWLQDFNVTFEKRRKIGSRIIASEKVRREIIARIFRKEINELEIIEMIKNLHENNGDTFIEKYVNSSIYDLFDGFDLNILMLIVKDFEKKLNYKFTDEGVAALIIHIAIAIKRVFNGNYVRLSENNINKLKTKPEYELASELVKSIEKYFKIKMPEDENCYILMHILGAKINNNEYDTEIELDGKLYDIVRNIVKNTETILDYELSNDPILLDSLTLHIKSAINRLENNLPIKNPYLKEIKNNYPMVFESAIVGFDFLNKKYGFKYNEDEIAYIAMHIQASIERKTNQKISVNYRILVVCSSGIGTSQLVTSKLKRLFKNIDIVDSVSVLELENYDLSTIDFIVSTVLFSNESVDVINVSPFLNERDIAKIEKKLINIEHKEPINKGIKFTNLLSLTNINLIYFNIKFASKEDLLKYMIEQLSNHGYVTDDYYPSVIERENISSTVLNKVAIPHGDYRKVLSDCISICVLKNPIIWSGELINIVILLVIRKEVTKKLGGLYKELNELVNSDELVKNLVNCKDKNEIIKTLERGV